MLQTREDEHPAFDANVEAKLMWMVKTLRTGLSFMKDQRAFHVCIMIINVLIEDVAHFSVPHIYLEYFAIFYVDIYR